MRRLRDDRGSAMIVTFFAAILMLGLGMGLLSVVDAQTREADKDRGNDEALSVAEGTLNAAAFLLSRDWPEAAADAIAPCSATTTRGGTIVTTASPASVAQRVGNLLAQSFTGTRYAGATWSLNVCDDSAVAPSPNRSTVWDAALLTTTNPAYDANGAQVDPTPSNPNRTVRRLWVRAQASVKGRTRAVAGLVQVNEAPVMPAGYGVVTGKFSNELAMASGSVLNSTLLRTLTEGVLNQHELVSGGKIGVRCNLVEGASAGQLCLTGALDAVSDSALGSMLSANEFVQYGDATAVDDARISALRREARADGTYYASLASGAECFPSTVNDPTKVVFVEQVGTGDQTCNVDLSGPRNVAVKALVIGSGRVSIRGSASAQTGGTLTGVAYGLNRQRLASSPPDSGSARDVVTIENGAKVIGGVFVDGSTGQVNIKPPKLTISQSVCSGLVLTRVACQAAAALGLIDSVLLYVSVSVLGQDLLGQLQAYGPALTYNAATVNAVTGYGSSGTLAGTFRQVPSVSFTSVTAP